MLRQTRATMSVIKKEVETGKVSKYFGATRTRSTRASAVVKTEDTDEPEIPLSPQQDPIAAASTRIRRVSGRLQQYQNRDDSIPITSSVKKEELDASIPSSDKKPQAANKKRRLTKVKVEVEVEQQPDAIPARTDHLAAEEPPHVGSLPVPKNFWPMYEEIKLMRSLVVSPVDTVGCAVIPTRICGQTSGRLFRFQLLISLMLSSQTKDEVNFTAMQTLDAHCKTAMGFSEDGLCLDAMLEIDEPTLDTLIFKVGFHRRKASYIKRTCSILNEKFNGDIPDNITDIVALPGIGQKMGNLILQCGWNITTGIGVDVHMYRLSTMWGWCGGKSGSKSKNSTPDTVRVELESWLPRDMWNEINAVLVGFGQMVCLPRGARCDLCTLAYKKLCLAVDRKLVNRAVKQRQLEAVKENGRVESESEPASADPATANSKKAATSRGDLSQLEAYIKANYTW
ncbi:unnamed protein product [[Candida] boidinii]|uniref:Endonuclease III homolog n=1 Tax=Candida boidinii TaxID=5477 RepID=A0A9W6SV13_CANBO|nr:unnamed protein product [[Candida] boidinii]GMF99980.1 unnamed protein product [[Candida] boidinii]